jgi:hypothetical protein
MGENPHIVSRGTELLFVTMTSPSFFTHAADVTRGLFGLAVFLAFCVSYALLSLVELIANLMAEVSQTVLRLVKTEPGSTHTLGASKRPLLR